MIHSTTHISSNEDNREEVHITRDMTLSEIIREAWRLKSFNFKKEVTKEYVRIGERYGVYAERCEVWVNKETSNEVSDEEHIQILHVQIQTRLNDLSIQTRSFYDAMKKE